MNGNISTPARAAASPSDRAVNPPSSANASAAGVATRASVGPVTACGLWAALTLPAGRNPAGLAARLRTSSPGRIALALADALELTLTAWYDSDNTDADRSTFERTRSLLWRAARAVGCDAEVTDLLRHRAMTTHAYEEVH